jgi:hypothetical protein
MNRTFDYNGVQIAPSKPVQKLRTVKKIVHIDSSDRDIVQYKQNGDFVVYLPRTYEKVVSINVKEAEFPITSTSTVKPWDIGLSATANASASQTYDPTYFFLELEGLNKSDETSQLADRSAATSSVFAKFQVPNATDRVQYNENSGASQCVYYQPSISKLDRLHVTVRLHSMKRNQYMYWSTTGANFSFTLELETLENSFDDFSSVETRVGERASSGFHGC